MQYSGNRRVQIACLFFCAVLLAANAQADGIIDSVVAHGGLGAGVTFYNPTNNDGQNSKGFALAYRWHRFQSGWGPTFGLDWHSTDFDQTLGGLNARLGSLRMRALLAGFGYTEQAGRLAVSANANGGYSFNNFTVADGARPAFASAGVSLVGTDVDNSWVVRSGVSVWYDIFKHVAVGVGAAYFVARPNQTITTATNTQEQHLKADALELAAGVTLGIWKNKP